MLAATDGVARTSATDVNQRVQAEPREGFVRFMDALRETRRAARLQKTLTYYQTIFGGSLICGVT